MTERIATDTLLAVADSPGLHRLIQTMGGPDRLHAVVRSMANELLGARGQPQRTARGLVCRVQVVMEVAGTGRVTDNLTLAGMLHAVIGRTLPEEFHSQVSLEFEHGGGRLRQQLALPAGELEEA